MKILLIQSSLGHLITPADNNEIAYFTLIGNATSGSYPSIINLDGLSGDRDVHIHHNKLVQNCRFAIRAYPGYQSSDKIDLKFNDNIITGESFTNSFYSIGIFHLESIESANITNNVFQDYDVNNSTSGKLWGIEVSTNNPDDPAYVIISDNIYKNIKTSRYLELHDFRGGVTFKNNLIYNVSSTQITGYAVSAGGAVDLDQQISLQIIL